MEDPKLTAEEINKAYYNSYRVITNKVTFEDLLDENIKEGSNMTYLSHDPDDDITPDIIQDVIDYFVELEEYELCAELKIELDKKLIT